ncbi:hypothetical protein C4544_01745 [candidate division WS5 bacterium]|uniref:Glycosyl hydrolase family 32 N-terminal domain-containing protein n=1 Tax=candidate division WS5 bacterium TaxID=2093353 RepID=A0A419DFB8_9BACT|nr:MAG: hypothetical protein C4544_01745 [candidate division WS5 bacterium]
MEWEKKGLIFSPAGQYPWVITHGMLPVADKINDDLFRIYFSGRDISNRSKIGYVEININEPEKILYLSENPILDLGKLGCFDDNGVSPTWIVNHDNKKYLYYFGWNKGSSVRAAEVSGLAISEDGGKTFRRYSAAPIIDRTNAEPYTILVISCILIENGIWRMWYDSADEWTSNDLPKYNIKYAESTDGIHWQRAGLVSVDYMYPGESRVSRASIVKEDGLYKMWYCYAIGSGGYKMGYAESEDGFKFRRMDDNAGIDISEKGWDSEMICYPYVFHHKGGKIMLYCGNGYGKTGFGYATL